MNVIIKIIASVTIICTLTAKSEELNFANLKNVTGVFYTEKQKIQYGVNADNAIKYIIISSSKGDDGLYVMHSSSEGIFKSQGFLMTNGIKNYGICSCCALIIIEHKVVRRLPFKNLKLDDLQNILSKPLSEKEFIAELAK